MHSVIEKEYNIDNIHYVHEKTAPLSMFKNLQN